MQDNNSLVICKLFEWKSKPLVLCIKFQENDNKSLQESWLIIRGDNKRQKDAEVPTNNQGR